MCSALLMSEVSVEYVCSTYLYVWGHVSICTWQFRIRTVTSHVCSQLCITNSGSALCFAHEVIILYKTCSASKLIPLTISLSLESLFNYENLRFNIEVQCWNRFALAVQHFHNDANYGAPGKLSSCATIILECIIVLALITKE